MFSYRHSFHAGNHADVLKHLTLVAVLQHLLRKDAALCVIDTHAGAGLYRLDGEHAQISGEARDGVLALLAGLQAQRGARDAEAGGSPHGLDDAQAVAAAQVLLDTYPALVARLNSGNRLVQDIRTYPGSPFLIQALLRPQDRLRLFELHPTDWRLLQAHVRQLMPRRQVSVKREDGFEALGAALPPAPINGSRRALVLIDPSYEIKSDYARVEHAIAQGLRRFATGCFIVWYPVIPRPEAHGLPRRLRTLAQNAGRSFVHATLSVGRAQEADSRSLSASGVFVINPPHTLKATLQAVLPVVLLHLGRGRGQAVEIF